MIFFDNTKETITIQFFKTVPTKATNFSQPPRKLGKYKKDFKHKNIVMELHLAYG